MPRKGQTPEQELAELKARQTVLEENVRLATRALNSNLSRQGEIKKELQHTKRVQLGTEVDEFGLTREEIMEALQQKKQAVLAQNGRDA